MKSFQFKGLAVARPLCFCLSLILIIIAGSGCAPDRTQTGYANAIASAHPLATGAGIETLQSGGNAFDAAVTVAAVLAVVEPYSSGLGGGGFWLLHRASDGKRIMLDGRERAPLAATRDMYLDASGNVVPHLSINGPLAAGIPGVPAALAHLAKKYGRLSLAQSLAPAIRLAREGFAVDRKFRQLAKFRLAAIQADASTSAIFLRNGKPPAVGELIQQPDLANTLEAIATQGAAGFYQGETAKRLIQGVRDAGGLWTQQDLDAYRIVERAPITTAYKDWQITSAAPPSSGGVAIVEMLHMLEQLSFDKLTGVDATHALIEVMRRAYRDRAEYLGDPDFVTVPVKKLTDRDYTKSLLNNFHPDEATPSDSLKPVDVSQHRSPDTTHFSILDRAGNRVSATLSINYPFGACFTPAGTGVLLNDEMDDFSAKPGVPNVYGLVGAEANAIAPGKRPLSSMSPTFVDGPDGFAIIGTPGGSRIITMVLQGALAYMHGDTAQQIVSRPRIHHQYLPDRVQFEHGALRKTEQDELTLRGHQLSEQSGTFGNMQVVLWHSKTARAEAASDPRGIGKAEVRP